MTKPRKQLRKQVQPPQLQKLQLVPTGTRKMLEKLNGKNILSAISL